MLYNAKNNSVAIDGKTMDYVEFGQGEKILIVLPGLADGLKTVKGQALNLAFYFRRFLKEFKVYVFSRAESLTDGCTTEDMALELNSALEKLGLTNVFLMGVSQGGMIAQWFAIHYPDKVEKLILTVSAARANETIRQALSTWIEYANNDDYKSLMVDTLEKTYSPKKLKGYRLLFPLLTRIGKPKSYERFFVQVNAILAHNAFDRLDSILCPTLIVGGDSDQVVGSEAAKELAAKIPNNHLILYQGLGHGTYEEAKDYNEQVIYFLLE